MCVLSITGVTCNSLTGLCPSNRVLLVDRQESRPSEWMARKFFSAFSAVSSSMSIPIQEVAKAMVSNTLLQPTHKTEILENKDIINLGKAAGEWESQQITGKIPDRVIYMEHTNQSRLTYCKDSSYNTSQHFISVTTISSWGNYCAF